MKKKTVQLLLMATTLSLPLFAAPSRAKAVTLTLLDLDFETPVITSSNTVVPAGAGVQGLPTGTLVTEPGGGVNPSWVNIRRHNNGIDGSGGINSSNFDNFFTTGNFLVLGDSTGNISGDNQGLSAIRIPLGMLPGATSSLKVGFDWVFDTNDATQGQPVTLTNGNKLTEPGDDFRADIVNGANTVLDSLLFVGTPIQNGSTRGVDFSTTIMGASLNSLKGQAGLALLLSLDEVQENVIVTRSNGTKFNLLRSSPGSSAVGLDNISVTATVPEPATLSLLGMGLLGGGISRRRRSQAQKSTTCEEVAR